ncbi:MAG: hypothetical protein ACLSDQ_02060 [Adlercreutzia equolifaciens]
MRELRLRLLQGRRRSGDVGDLLLQVGAGRLKLRALLSGEVRHLQGGLGLGQGVLQRRQCRIGFGEVRLIGGDLLLGLGELRLGVGLALGKRCRALGVLLLAVLDLLLARRKRGSGCIQLALALVQLFLGRIQLGAGIGELVFARASSSSYSARASSKSAWASAFRPSTRACSRAGAMPSMAATTPATRSS